MTAIDVGPTSWLAAADPSYNLLVDLAGQPTLSADVNLGDNDDWGVGQQEFWVGDGSATTSTAGGQRVWDPAADESLDSGWVDVRLELSAGGGTGGVALTVGGDGVTYDQASYGYIQGLQVRAYAYGRDRSFEWQDLKFEFYHNGVLDNSVSLADGPRASTYGGDELSYSEKVINVGPPSTNDDAVIVTAQVHLSVGYMPGLSGDDLSGQINLFATTAGSG